MPDASDNELLSICRALGLADLTQSLPGGLGGTIYEGGSNVSGGERQRIDIARHFLSNARVLILDEATSGLDETTETAVLDAIRSRGFTCIHVTHRPSVLAKCDDILVLQNGMITERGPHNRLLDTSHDYRCLLGDNE